MDSISNVLLSLQRLNVGGANGIATRSLADGTLAHVNGADIAPGRRVWDSVTGQWVEVVSAGHVYLPAAVIEGVKGGE